jgi:regulator of PEP synthase PpsR (kinase-PPPase family)
MKITKEDLTPKPKEVKTKARASKEGRVPFTTVMKPEIRQQLQTIADNLDTSVSQVLETIVLEYINELKRNETKRND